MQGQRLKNGKELGKLRTPWMNAVRKGRMEEEKEDMVKRADQAEPCGPCWREGADLLEM